MNEFHPEEGYVLTPHSDPVTAKETGQWLACRDPVEVKE